MGINSDSDLRPKGSNQKRNKTEEIENREIENRESDESSESEIVIPESTEILNTPSLEEYTKHQITHYPFQAWCPICVNNAAAQNNPHKKVQHIRQTEMFSIRRLYVYLLNTK